jgi:DNA-binding HxlR family transcriptional regulator
MTGPAEVAEGPGAVGEGSLAPEFDGAESTGTRSAERALTVLSTRLNLSVLQALTDRPMRLAELRQAAGLPAQTTLRGHLGALTDLGALTRSPTKGTPFAVENELTPMGRELLGVAGKLESWLDKAPEGPISLDSGPARGVIKALVDGWGSRILAGLAVRPRSLTELDREISDLSYPALERRLSSMRMANLIEVSPSHGARTPYVVTEWARRGIGPLAAASRCERLHMGEQAAPVTEGDIEAAFLLATPLVRLGDGISGRAQLEIEAAPGRSRTAGVGVMARAGRVTCDTALESNPVAFAIGPTAGWFRAILDGELDLLSFVGGQLPEELVRGLHEALTGF